MLRAVQRVQPTNHWHLPTGKTLLSEQYESPMTYNCRSAVFYQMNEIKACYRDIQRAIEAGYPDHLTYKLMDRKGKCLMKFSRFAQAIESFETSLEYAKATVKDEKRLKVILSDIEKLMKTCQGRESVGSDPFDSTKNSRMPKLGGCANPLIPSFSKALELCYDENVILK